jgi:hypothetical protein
MAGHPGEAGSYPLTSAGRRQRRLASPAAGGPLPKRPSLAARPDLKRVKGAARGGGAPCVSASPEDCSFRQPERVPDRA